MSSFEVNTSIENNSGVRLRRPEDRMLAVHQYLQAER